MHPLLPLALVALAAAPALAQAPAQAGTGTGTVRGRVRVTAEGKPADAAGVLVYVTGFEEPPPGDIPELRQRGRQFQPALLAITAGQSVAFPNGDAFFHNVFSLSPARRFDLGQFREGESKVKVFPRPGIVEVYCNIHPDMAATILVLPNRRHATTGPDGSFVLEGLPPGTFTLFAYHRLADRPAKIEVTVEPGKTLEGIELEIDERRTPTPHRNKYGDSYGRP